MSTSHTSNTTLASATAMESILVKQQNTTVYNFTVPCDSGDIIRGTTHSMGVVCPVLSPPRFLICYKLMYKHTVVSCISLILIFRIRQIQIGICLQIGMYLYMCSYYISKANVL